MRYLLILLLVMNSINAQTLQDTLVGKSATTSDGIPNEVQAAFEKMKTAAAKEGIRLSIVSGYRSYERQQQIWNRKYKKYQAQGLVPDAIFDKIVEYSTVPGTSRHHWGTDLDIIDTAGSYSGDVLVPSKFHGDGPFCKMKDWMDAHAASFGFELVYTNNAQRPGFKYEPWHWSYVPLSRKRYHQYTSHIDLKTFLRNQSIMGMDKISDERIERYFKEHVQGINPALKNK